MGSLVSILVPAYNADLWLKECLESAQCQTWKNKEIIVVDDGSTDYTLSVAKTFQSASVKVISQDNMGASSARNAALRFAQGDYIQWLDADDVLAVDKIEQQLIGSESGQSSLNLLSSAFGRFHTKPRLAKFRQTPLWKSLSPVEWLITRFSNRGVWMTPPSWLVSRRLTELAGPWDESLTFDDDGEYFSRLVSLSEHVQFVGTARSFYRAGTNGLSSRRSLEAARSSFRASQQSIGYLLKLEQSDRTTTACLAFLNFRAHEFSQEFPEVVDSFQDLAVRLGGRIHPAPGRRLLARIHQSSSRFSERLSQILSTFRDWLNP